jgi:hypothetical protein
MQSKSQFVVVSVVLTLLALTIGPAGAQEAPASPEVGACLPGVGYASGCDVDQDGDIDIFDIQRTAGRWNSNGVYTSGHTHWGETWTGTGTHGLRLENTTTSGTSYGVFGQSASTGGLGVFGYATASSGNTYGVHGVSDSPNGRGTGGYASATSGQATGVYGLSDSTAGRGVYGWASAGNGLALGMYGRSDSTTGTGVLGYASATSGANYGVYGQSDSADGVGVYGLALAGSGTNYGVYGVSGSPSGYAGYFFGRVHVAGTLSKAAGSFKIDHPLDPANQYLSHSFVESPDMMNVYNGNITLDAQGEAWVDLPDWFEALNRDFRYQLTSIGGPGPNLYTVQEVQDNRFQIAGGKAGLRVSWQVTGIRQDAYANAHRIPVEEAKPADEAGLHLHPTERGQPAELGLDYQRNSALR